MTSAELVAEGLGCGFEMQDGILVRPSGSERLVLFIGANYTPGEIQRGEQPGGWAIRDARQPLLPGSWAEINRVGAEIASFSLRERAGWSVWLAGLANRLSDPAFARRFQLDGDGALAHFNADVRMTLTAMPKCAGFRFYVMREGRTQRARMVANWPLERAPSGVVRAAAHVFDLIASSAMPQTMTA